MLIGVNLIIFMTASLELYVNRLTVNRGQLNFVSYLYSKNEIRKNFSPFSVKSGVK